jgi:cell division protein ZapE
VTGSAAAPAEGIGQYVGALLAKRGGAPDPAQLRAIERLQRLADELAEFRVARESTLPRLFAPPEVPRGVYLWGGVGRGKSLLMDAFHARVAIRRKTRVHFHAFMRDVHRELAGHAREEDPLALVAERIAQRYRLICFDEFHVSDVADAMILGRLLTALFTHGVVFVMTSNYPPESLWPNGLNRDRFLPTIDLLHEWLDVLRVDGGTDYRLRTLEQVPSFHCPAGPAADAALAQAFNRMAESRDEDPQLAVEGRTLVARRRAGSAVWFDFATLCDGPRSQRDYLELARCFAVIMVSGVPQLGPATADQARRFTWLVDILYDHRVKLLLSAAVPAERLYTEGPNAQEFPRTVSRLAEMRTRDYMALPHSSEEAPPPVPAAVPA